MSSQGPVAVPGPDDDLFRRLTERLLELISNVPSSEEEAADNPSARTITLVATAALKSAGISGGLALPPGPLGLITVLPDLYAIWRVQAHLVSDIAAVYGQSAHLTREAMLYCLFRHAAAQAVRDLVVRAGERVLIRRTTLHALQTTLRRVGIVTTQRLIGRGVSRWLPFVGAAGVAVYAYYDTRQVGRAAIELFSRDIDDDDDGQTAELVPPSSPLGAASSSAVSETQSESGSR